MGFGGGKPTGESCREEREYADRQGKLIRDCQAARNRRYTGNWHEWLRGNRDYTTTVPPLEVVPPYCITGTPTTTARENQEERSGISLNSFGDYFNDVDIEGLRGNIWRMYECGVNTSAAQSASVGTTTDPMGNEGGSMKQLIIPHYISLKNLILNFRKRRFGRLIFNNYFSYVSRRYVRFLFRFN